MNERRTNTAYYVQVLLQVEYFITVSPELQPGFFFVDEVNNFCRALFVGSEPMLIVALS
ncbi:MAG: hypothetical protein ACXWWD_04165 [Chitinophagaceae bacterium]